MPHHAGIQQGSIVGSCGRRQGFAAPGFGVERVVNRVGFRRLDDQGRWEYMVLPQQWRGEVAKGFDASTLARAMVERRLIICTSDGKAAKPVNVPGHRTMRLYVLALGIIGDVEGNDAG
jgi:hypothetical protein